MNIGQRLERLLESEGEYFQNVTVAGDTQHVAVRTFRTEAKDLLREVRDENTLLRAKLERALVSLRDLLSIVKEPEPLGRNPDSGWFEYANDKDHGEAMAIFQARQALAAIGGSEAA